ncbi:hypothetical protein BHM03_00061295 [Ensete ventricosum]|nr:hypothetical protein BHM03_00061295 [Ensete ventricosum]
MIRPLPSRGEFSSGVSWVANLGPLEDEVSLRDGLGSYPSVIESGNCPLIVCFLIFRSEIIDSQWREDHLGREDSFGAEGQAVGRLLGNLSGEIVYPCIPDPDGEDEGGQASSSLAVSTRWISVAKLLQSDIATLAQREGGEIGGGG